MEDTSYSSRKFLITVGLLLMGFILVVINKLEVSVFLEFAKFVGAFYIGANAIQTIGTSIAGK